MQVRRAALDLLDRTAERAVFVGDSYEADYEGPTAAGMAALLIDPSAHSPVDERSRITSVLDVESRVDALLTHEQH